jgi:hypothetical protein
MQEAQERTWNMGTFGEHSGNTGWCERIPHSQPTEDQREEGPLREEIE